jgi:hypothetical protein
MKGLVLVVIIFVICAMIGFQIANNLDQSSTGGQENVAVPTDNILVQQHNLIVIHIDRLDSQEPRLMSVWFVSFFFVEGSSPVLTIAPIYPARSGTAASLERAFSLNSGGEPSQGFWKAIRAMKFKWEAFLVVDDFAVQKVMEWTNGPGNYPPVLENTLNNPTASREILIRTCQSVGEISTRGEAPLKWNDLVPAHLHSNLRMELALTYWNNLTTSALPIGCEVPLK